MMYKIAAENMSERQDKTPDQVSDEDYKLAPTSADEEALNKQRAATDKKEHKATGESESSTDTKVKEELREGVE
jgi:hypothetical protein